MNKNLTFPGIQKMPFLYAGNLSVVSNPCLSGNLLSGNLQSGDIFVRSSFFSHAQCVPAIRIYYR